MNKTSSIVAILGGLLAITGFSTILSATALAQSVSISVSPMVTIQPMKGSQAKANFSVTNAGETPIRTRIYAEDFDYDREEGYVKIARHPSSATPYLQFSPRELTIAPGVTREVRVNITIPPSQPDKEYRVAVFTEDLTERKPSSGRFKSVIRPQIASIFYIAKGKLTTEISAESVSWDPKQNIPRLLLKNRGQVSAYPDINWKLSQGKTEITSGIIRGIVLQSERERIGNIEIAPEIKLKPGNYTLVGEIDSKNGKNVPFSLSLTIPSK
jgi:P pilus assembly chaperone PapD